MHTELCTVLGSYHKFDKSLHVFIICLNLESPSSVKLQVWIGYLLIYLNKRAKGLVPKAVEWLNCSFALEMPLFRGQCPAQNPSIACAVSAAWVIGTIWPAPPITARCVCGNRFCSAVFTAPALGCDAAPSINSTGTSTEANRPGFENP